MKKELDTGVTNTHGGRCPPADILAVDEVVEEFLLLPGKICLFGDYYILDTIAPWIRGIITFTPDPASMRNVPLSYKVHIISALALLAFSPFSRLVHIWSAPAGYFLRGWVMYRRKVVE